MTPSAEEALVDIARWTIRTFGEAQAYAYETTLVAACDAIADGTAQVRDRSCPADAGSGQGAGQNRHRLRTGQPRLDHSDRRLGGV